MEKPEKSANEILDGILDTLLRYQFDDEDSWDTVEDILSLVANTRIYKDKLKERKEKQRLQKIQDLKKRQKQIEDEAQKVMIELQKLQQSGS